MEMPEAGRRTIEDVLNSMECPWAFACCQPGCGRLCPTRVTAGGKLLECREDRQQPCRFAVDFGIGRFCECPLRVFLLENTSYEKDGHA